MSRSCKLKTRLLQALGLKEGLTEIQLVLFSMKVCCWPNLGRFVALLCSGSEKEQINLISTICLLLGGCGFAIPAAFWY